MAVGVTPPRYRKEPRGKGCATLSLQPLKSGESHFEMCGVWGRPCLGMLKVDVCGDDAWEEAVLMATCPWTLPWKVASLWLRTGC